MDALILSVGTGGGHNAAGYAIKEELIRRGHNAVMINPYDLAGKRTSRIIDNSYIKLVQKAPKLFGAVYFLGNAYRKLPWRSPVYFANIRMSGILQKYLQSNHFDAVIMPHVFPAEMMTALKNKGVKIPKTVFVSTDYTCIPFVEETKCDAYITPSPELNGEFIKHMILKDRFYPLGIPTASAYKKIISKEKAAKELGLDPSKKYILIAGGSMGSGKLLLIVGHILSWCRRHKGYVPIVVCGSNKKLYRNMKHCFGRKIIAVQFTKKMHLYMKACEVFFTKPGGLSTTEAATAGIPIVHITPIPGCESANMRFFSERGMSICAKNRKESIFSALDRLTRYENRLNMAMNQRKYIDSGATSHICNLIEELCSDKSEIKSLSLRK